jgi:hypothetical protein
VEWPFLSLLEVFVAGSVAPHGTEAKDMNWKALDGCNSEIKLLAYIIRSLSTILLFLI